MRYSPKPASLAIETIEPARRSTMRASTGCVTLNVENRLSWKAFCHRSGVSPRKNSALPFHGLEKEHVLGHLEARQTLLRQGNHFCVVQRGPRRPDDPGAADLAPPIVRQADDVGLCHRVMGRQQLLDLLRSNQLAA